MFAVSVAAEALSAVPHCWDGHRVGMEGVSILSDKVSILSSEWQNLSLFLGNIGDYILHRRYIWNILLFYILILLWYVVYSQQLSFSNESLLKTVSHFVPWSSVPVSRVPRCPGPSGGLSLITAATDGHDTPPQRRAWELGILVIVCKSCVCYLAIDSKYSFVFK